MRDPLLDCPIISPDGARERRGEKVEAATINQVIGGAQGRLGNTGGHPAASCPSLLKGHSILYPMNMTADVAAAAVQVLIQPQCLDCKLVPQLSRAQPPRGGPCTGR